MARDVVDLEDYVAEMERKVENLELAMRRLNSRMDAVSSLVAREVLSKVRGALEAAVEEIEL